MDIDDFKRELANLIEQARACDLCPFEVSVALDEASESATSDVTISLTQKAIQ